MFEKNISEHVFQKVSPSSSFQVARRVVRIETKEIKKEHVFLCLSKKIKLL